MGTGEQLFEQLNNLRGSKTVIIGIGNILKGDDGLGPWACQQLQLAEIGAELIDVGTVPENYIQPIIKKAPQNLLVIDAIDFGAQPGTINVFKPEQLNSSVFSTHTLSPRLFVDVIRQQIDIDVYIVGIQPTQMHLGQSLSTEVSKAVRLLIDSLCRIFPPTK